MISKVRSAALIGVTGFPVTVEADSFRGLPSFDIVGLPDTAVKESKERVKAALRNSGFDLPPQKTVINLAPADIKKEGSVFDLAIAVALLISDGKIDNKTTEGCAFFGELSLAGEVKRINGALPLALSARSSSLSAVFVPSENAKEASLASGVTVYGVKSLYEVYCHLSGESPIAPTVSDPLELMRAACRYDVDFSDVKGQPALKRAFEIAAAGGHNVIVIGSPGSGKSMLAKRLPTILPDMSVSEAIDTTRVYSAAGLLDQDMPMVSARPFRSPHHNISLPGLIGGGADAKPGEVSLAHNGVLFLDEFLEFQPKALEGLRQPLEDGKVTISRAAAANTYPCKMVLVLAANPCPCGYYGDKRRRCTCSQTAVNRYLAKMSGPLLDRMDIQVEASSLTFDVLTEKSGETSADVKKRVETARAAQKKRYGSDMLNSDLKTEEQLSKFCALDSTERAFLEDAFRKLGLSVRAYASILSIARTIADLDGSENIEFEHLSEAISYRRLENKYWNR